MVNSIQINNNKKNLSHPKENFSNTLNSINRDFAEKKVAEHADVLKIPYVDLRITPINPNLSQEINSDEAETAIAVPFFVIGKKICVAIAEPEKSTTKEYIEKLKNKYLQIQLNLASTEGIFEKIKQIRSEQPTKIEKFENRGAEVDLKTYEEEIQSLNSLEKDAFNTAARDILNRIFVGALRTGASDVHFQPEESQINIRFRIDGVLQKILSFNKKIGGGVTDQLKYESRLRLNVTDTPQDGRTQFLANNRKIDVRVSTLPTEFGESIVCRLLDSGKKTRSFEELGFLGTTLKNIHAALELRSGMILSTGPTGSGKTTTLYSMLAELNQPKRKVATLENPIEYHLENVVQSQINEEQNYTFSDGLRALLRQDPDVLMVGEIRDSDTAETAAQAAMTGHVVLSTLHTNSAGETIPRLLNLGMKPFMLTSSLALIIAQRLVRRPCPKCAEKITPNTDQINAIKKHLNSIKKYNSEMNVGVPDFLWKTKGCLFCGHTGYRGQLIIAESFRMDDKIRELILTNTPLAKIILYARESQGMISFTEDGLLKACLGLTTFAEINRITGVKIIDF